MTDLPDESRIHRGRARHHFRGAGPVAALLIAPIRFYQRFITVWTPATCRYHPSCSAYAVTALRERGALVGLALTVRRLIRCNPWSAGGVDHVPRRRERGTSAGSSVIGPVTASSTSHHHHPDRDPVGYTEKSPAA